MNRLTFIEFSSKGTVIFVAGGNESAKDGASVAAVRFSSNIKLINEFKIQNAGEMIYSIKRHENGNIIFAGAKSKVIILFFDGTNFESIAEYPNLPLESITHFQNLEEELYCVSPEKDIMLKIIYASRSAPPISKEKPKIDKAVLTQFQVAAKKTVPMTSKPTWVKLGPGNKELQFKCLGKLNSIEKKEGKSSIDVSQAMKDLGIVFQDLQKLQDGRFIISLPHSNVLKLVTSSGDEITSFEAKGPQSYDPSVASLVCSRSTDSHIFLWPMGQGYLGILDLQRMEIDKVPRMGGLGSEDSLAHLIIASQNGSKVMSVSLQNSSSTLFFSFWQKMEPGKIVTRSAEYIYPKRKLI